MESPTSVQVHADSTALLAFLAYLIFIIAVGLASARFSSKGLNEFFLGGRKMNRFVVALSAVVSGRSAWLLIGFTGLAYARGVSALWAAVGYIFVELLLFLYLAPVLRKETENSDSLTIPDYFEARFKDRSGLLRLVSVVIIFIFMLAYVAAQFKAGGKAFASGFGLSETEGLLITAGIVLLYTLLGGFLAVSITDLFQAFLMVFALLLLPLIAVHHFGGAGEVMAALRDLDPALVDPGALSFGVLIGFLGIGLGSPGNPHILVRYMSIREARQLRTSAIVGTAWNIIMAAGALLIGLVGRAIYTDSSLLPGADRENLFPHLAYAQLPPVLFGLIIAAIFAAIMSTADSQLLVASSSLVRDLYQKVLCRSRDIDNRRLVFLSRMVILGLVGLALVLGALAEEWIFWLVLFAWAGLGAALGPTLILSLFWSGANRRGVLAGMVTGTVTVIVWKSVPALSAMIYELVPGFAFAALMTVGVSWVTKKRDQELHS